MGCHSFFQMFLNNLIVSIENCNNKHVKNVFKISLNPLFISHFNTDVLIFLSIVAICRSYMPSSPFLKNS